ncbi:MAG TPA: type IV secretion system DNA-binding domain-containing protein [Mycobacteriales bacterium]|nr:type IV secretion system DNA-binding domain-containing protein [Mycobacteriales bacterium]
MRRSPEPRTWLQVVVPRDNRSAPFTAEQLYAALHAATGRGQWTEVLLVGAPRHVGIYLRAERSRVAPVRALVRATYPDAEVVPAEPPLPHDPVALAGARWRLREHVAYPIKTVREFENSEPMAMTLGALAEAGEDGECGIVHLALAPAPLRFHRDAHALALALVRGEVPQPLWARALNVPLDVVETVVTSLLSTPTDAPATPPPVVVHANLDAQLKWVNGKAAQPAFTATIRTAWTAPAAVRAAEGHAALVAALGQFAVPGQNALEPAQRLTAADWLELLAGVVARRERVVLGTAELAGLCHLPGPDLVVPHLARTGARRREQRHQVADDALILAETTHRDRHEPVGMRVRDLMTHGYVVGPSGTGKTTMLVRLVLELAAQRTAAVVLDPHGDLTRNVLATIPDDAADRVRLFDITDPAALPTINPLWLPPQPNDSAAAVARAVRSAAVTAVFADLWRLDKATAPNLMHFLEAALAALVATGDGCLADLPRFLTDAPFRADVVRRANDARIDARWREFGALSPDDRSRTVRAILNKAADFDRNPILATIFGDPGPGLRLDDVMDNGQVLLVNLPRGLVPEGTVELVGSLLVTQLYQAALAREARPPSERPPVVAVIDEFQEFALSTFAKIVTATRKYGLGLVVANQNLSRLHAVGADVLSTLLANVGTLVAFRTGSADAEYLASMFDPFDADDLRTQAAHECYWRLTVDGTPQPVVSARSLPPVPPSRSGPGLDEFAAAARVAGRPLVIGPTAVAGEVFG